MTQTPPQGPPTGYGPPPPGYQPPMVPPGYELKRKKRRKWPWVLLALVAIIVIIAVSTSHSGGSGISAGSGTGSGGSGPGTDTIVYSVTSDASSISATYTTFNGSNIAQAQDNSTTPPWTKTVTAQKSWFHSDSLIAQMNPAALSGGGKDGTTITCTITVNGKQVAKQTSTGQYATVTCDVS